MRFTKIVFICIFAGIVWVVYAFFAPINAPVGTYVEIPYGSSISNVGKLLEDNRVIRSKNALSIIARITKGNMIAGRYKFEGNESIFYINYRLVHGIRGVKEIKITIPEGFTSSEISARINKQFPNIPKDELDASLIPKEGYIFPETYFFDAEASKDEIVNKLINKSNNMLAKILSPIDINSNEAKTIIIKASLVEAEGRTTEERRVIAGIIENRLNKNMPLELDATITYLTGRASSQITIKDIRINSPYNTYKNTGLPPAPIDNPGNDSISATQNPTKTSYLYYLHDKNGNIHYAVTYIQHLRNKIKYLK